MRFGNRHLSGLLLAKGLIFAFLPLAALAAEGTGRRHSVEELTLWTWVFICFFSLIGWAVVDLDKLADLRDTEGKKPHEVLRQKLVLLRGVLTSLTAGVTMFFCGKMFPVWFITSLGVTVQKDPEIPEMALFLLCFAAGMMGTKWFDWIKAKVFK